MKQQGNGVQTVVSLDVLLTDKCESFAHRRNMSFSNLVADALKFYMKNNDLITTYIMGDYSGNIKIGKTKNVDRRLRQFQCGNPTIKLLMEYSGDVESVLHQKYDKFRVSSNSQEWFCLDEKQLEELVFEEHFRIVDEDDYEQFIYQKRKAGQ